MNVGRGTVTENPLFHFTAYSLRNPVVVEALERGLYDAICTLCTRGRVFDRPCPNLEPGASDHHGQFKGCRRCTRWCPECRGRYLRKDFAICRQDFLGEEDMAIAEQVMPGVTESWWFNERQLR